MDRGFKSSCEQNRRLPDVEERTKSGGGVFFHTPSQWQATFDSTHRSFPGVQAQQRLGTNWKSFPNRRFSSYPSWAWSSRSINGHLPHNVVTRAFPLIPNRSIATASSKSFFKGHGLLDGRRISQQSTRKKQKLPAFYDCAPLVSSPTTTAAASPMEPNRACPSQMTIFYGGRVCAFDDIPIEKFQEIMLLASNGSKISLNTAHTKTQTPLMASEKVGRMNQLDLNQNPAGTIDCRTHRSADPPSPGSVTSHPVRFKDGNRKSNGYDQLEVAAFAGSSCSNDCITAAKRPNDSSLLFQAVPTARKASLARFLERRKERINKKAPYLSGKNVAQIASN